METSEEKIMKKIFIDAKRFLCYSSSKVSKVSKVKIMKKFFIIPILFIPLTACGPMPPPSLNSVQGGSIVEVTLEDGTRCAVFDGVEADGLSCNWR